MSDKDLLKIVKEPDSEFQSFFKAWTLVDDLLLPNKEFREKYLERKPLETFEFFKIRKELSFIPPYGYETQLAAARNKVGLRLNELITVNDLHPKIAKLLDPQTISQIAFIIFQDILHYGGGGGLVLYDTEKKQPYFLNLKSPSFFYSTPNILKFKTCEQQLETNFSEKLVEKITIFTKTKDGIIYNLFEVDEENILAIDQNIEISNSFGKKIERFPVVYGATRNINSYFRNYPVMQKLAEQTLKLFQTDSDISNILNIILCPILVKNEALNPVNSIGFSNTPNGEQLGRSPDAFLIIDIDERIGFVDTRSLSTSLESGFQNREEIKKSMGQLGHEVLYSNNPTATARIADQAQSDTGIGAVLVGLEVALNQLLELYGFWLDIEPEQVGNIQVNTDVSSILLGAFTSETHTSLRNDFMAGGIDQTAYIQELVSRGVFRNIRNDQDIEEMIQRMIAQGGLPE